MPTVPFPLVCSPAIPLLLETPLCPLDRANVEGPASGVSSSDTERVESASVSVSLMLVAVEGTEESSGIRARSTDVTELRLLTLCRFLARKVSESEPECVGDEASALEEGWRKDKDGGVAECGINKSGSSSSSSRRERVAGIRLGLVAGDRTCLLGAGVDDVEEDVNGSPAVEVGCGNEVDGTLPRAELD